MESTERNTDWHTAGFTLVEVIVSLVLVGFLAAAAGVGIVAGARSFSATRENTEVLQKAQFALKRISREVQELTAIGEAKGDLIRLSNLRGDVSIGLVGNAIRLEPSAAVLSATSPLLLDGVSSFALVYETANDTGSTWKTGDDLRSLVRISISIGMLHEDGDGSVTFTTRAHMRNTRNYGGAPITTTPPTPPDLDCFIETVKGAGLNGNTGPFKVDTGYGGGFVAGGLLLLFFRVLQKGRFWNRKKTDPSRSKPFFPRFSNTEGGLLIGVLLTLTALAILGAGMLSVSNTGTFSTVADNGGDRAYYLAESGYRYGGMVYLRAGDAAAKDDALQALDGRRVLVGGEDSFDLSVSSYYYRVQSVSGNRKKLTVAPLGGFPPDLVIPGTGSIVLQSPDGGTSFGTYPYKSAVRNGDTMEFTITSGTFRDVAAGTNVFPVATTGDQDQTVKKGGTLALQAGDGTPFPKRNGTVRLFGRILSYGYRSANQLHNIQDPYDVGQSGYVSPIAGSGLQIPGDTQVRLEKAIRFESTGTTGTGEVRNITYHVPIGFVSGGTKAEKVQWNDTMESLDNWFTDPDKSLGRFVIANVDGNNALHVQSGETVGDGIFTNYEGSLISLNWGRPDSGIPNLAWSWFNAENTLSYDAQVKLKVTEAPFFNGGLSFRLDQDANCYGVSYMNAAASNSDGIPDGMVPVSGQPMVVLWQQLKRGNGYDWDWLAYKTVGEEDHVVTSRVLFSDDAEGGFASRNKWSSLGGWSQRTEDANSPTHSWGTGPYRRNADMQLISERISLPQGTQPVLTFMHLGALDGSRLDDCEVWVRRRVRWWLGQYWQSWSRLRTFDRNSLPSAWSSVQIPLSRNGDNLTGVQVAFRLDADGSGNNMSAGWFVDDIAISETQVEWPTLLVRVKEKAAVKSDDPFDGREFRNERVNDMQVMIADIEAHGAQGDDFKDKDRHANPRGTVNWPETDLAETKADTDNFTLIQWDAVNPAMRATTRLTGGDRPTDPYYNTVIRSRESRLLTPETGSPTDFTRPEVGLHTWGWYSEQSWFDDFGLQLEFGTAGGNTGFLPPVQE